MKINSSTNSLLTIRQASKALGLPVGTIHSWLAKGVFVPFQPAEPRDPKGSRLDIGDLVWLSVLMALFSLGLRINDLLPHELALDTEGLPDIVGAFISNNPRRPQLLVGQYQFNAFARVTNVNFRLVNDVIPVALIHLFPAERIARQLESVREWAFRAPVSFIAIKPHHEEVLRRIQGL